MPGNNLWTKRLSKCLYLELLDSVWIDNRASTPRPVSNAMPQSSVLKPLLFMLYTADIGNVIKTYGLELNFYSDDGLIYLSYDPPDAVQLCIRAIDCIVNVKSRKALNRLVLNPIKAEFLWLSTQRRKYLINRRPFVLDGAEIVRINGCSALWHSDWQNIFFFNGHTRHLTRNCYQLHRIKAIRCYIPTSVTIQLLHAFVLSWIDYCNSILHGPARYSAESLTLCPEHFHLPGLWLSMVFLLSQTMSIKAQEKSISFGLLRCNDSEQIGNAENSSNSNNCIYLNTLTILFIFITIIYKLKKYKSILKEST